MNRLRVLLVIAIIAGLGAVVVLGLTSEEGEEVAAAATTSSTVATTTTTTAAPTTTVAATTSTTAEEQRIEEVREIVQQLWFGWFDAIYRKDEDALWEVVATRDRLESGVEAMEQLRFQARPTLTEVEIVELEILLDRPDCLVVYVVTDLSAFRGPEAGRADIVSVLWPTEQGEWRFASHWANKVDLWMNDCDLRERDG